MSEKRFINANDIDFRFSCDYANGEIFVNINDVKKAIAMTPTADVVEVRHGTWKPRTDVPGFVRCSVCKECNVYDEWVDGKKWGYCPQCGAKMDIHPLKQAADSLKKLAHAMRRYNNA